MGIQSLPLLADGKQGNEVTEQRDLDAGATQVATDVSIRDFRRSYHHPSHLDPSRRRFCARAVQERAIKNLSRPA